MMTQGIGFPLRPVDSVPPKDSGDLSGLVAAGIFLQWTGSYQSGRYHPKGSVTRVGDFLMVANTLTLDYPGPVSTAPPEWMLPDVFTTESDSSVVTSGSLVNFTESGVVKALRVWVPEIGDDIDYRVLIIDRTIPDAPVTTTIASPGVVAGDWSVVTRGSFLVPAGSQLEVLLEAINSGADTIVAGGWTYAGIDNINNPAIPSWNRDQQHTIVRFAKTDLDGTDRTSELLGVIPTSTLIITSTADPSKTFAYRVISTTDAGAAVVYDVELTAIGNEGPATGTTSVEFKIPVPLPTKYSVDVGGSPIPTWATVAGVLYFDGVAQSRPNDAFGVDIEFEQAEISPDWDIMAIDT